MRETATGREEGDLREARIDTTLGANHFGGKRTETRPLGRRRLGNKASTIWKMLFGADEGDDDPALKTNFLLRDVEDYHFDRSDV
jgi:hypothetical protein